MRTAEVSSTRGRHEGGHELVPVQFTAIKNNTVVLVGELVPKLALSSDYCIGTGERGRDHETREEDEQ